MDSQVEVTGDRALQARLTKQGCRFDFFKAVWLIERSLERGSPVGQRGPVAEEAMRFRPAVSLGFPSTDVRRIWRMEDPSLQAPYFLMEVTFLGLYGVSTPLPLHYAINILRQVHATDRQLPPDDPQLRRSADPYLQDSTPARDFLDVLHHRVISLFYRAWLKYRYHFQYGMEDRDAVSRYMLRLIGVSPEQDYDDYHVSPTRMLRYAGSIVQRPRSASMLQGMLVDYWEGLPINVEQCVGRWAPIDPSDMNDIGLGNCTLGVDLTVGESIYDLNGRFNIVIGPVDWDTYLTFLPDGRAFAETRAIVQLFMTDPLAYTFEIVLAPDTIPELRLGEAPSVGRLGYTSWAMTEDPGEVSIVVESHSEDLLRGLPPRKRPDEAAVATGTGI